MERKCAFSFRPCLICVHKKTSKCFLYSDPHCLRHRNAHVWRICQDVIRKIQSFIHAGHCAVSQILTTSCRLWRTSPLCVLCVWLARAMCITMLVLNKITNCDLCESVCYTCCCTTSGICPKEGFGSSFKEQGTRKETINIKKWVFFFFFCYFFPTLFKMFITNSVNCLKLQTVVNQY